MYVAAPLAGRIESVAVQPGQTVTAGQPLFTLESASEAAARDEAAARFRSAQAQATNLDSGRRAEEIAVTQAQLAQARASTALARSELERQQQLAAQGFVSRARMDDASTALALAQAHQDELLAALQVARLPARTDERTATQASAAAAQAVVRQSAWRIEQKTQSAPTAALVSDVVFQVGEFVPAGQAVIALLPPGQIKARFYVGQADLPTLKLGDAVDLHCDGCQPNIQATITRIASQPEYTPPVIYSNAQRNRLVFMVEARPDAAQAHLLKPGQPVDVARIDPARVQSAPASKP